MLAPRRVLVLVPALCIAVVACDARDANRRAVLPPDRERVTRQIDWPRIGGIEPALDSELLNPYLMQVTIDQLLIYDGADHSVKSFGYDGQLRWRIGRRGQGPGEFQSPTDLQVAADGTIWVIDSGNARITILESSGRVDREIRIPAGIGRLAPTSSDEIWAITGSGPSFVLRLSMDGRELGRLNTPAELDTVPPMSRQAYVAGGGGTGYQLVISFLYSDRYLAYRDNELRDIRGVDNVAFPPMVSAQLPGGVATRVDPNALQVGGSIGISGRHLYVHTLGHDPRFVDVIDLEEGVYRETLILPDSAHRIAVVPSTARLAYLYASPAPGVHILAQPSTR